MEIFYLLQHRYRTEDHEDIKYIGLFSDEKAMNNTMEILRNKPGFNKFPEGFFVSEMILDKIYWEDGFEYYKSKKEK